MQHYVSQVCDSVFLSYAPEYMLDLCINLAKQLVKTEAYHGTVDFLIEHAFDKSRAINFKEKQKRFYDKFTTQLLECVPQKNATRWNWALEQGYKKK